jgi:hypothetical protein
MGDVQCFNNKLSFLKSVTTLIVVLPFFLVIENDGEHRSPFRGIVFFKDSNVHHFYNFLSMLQLFHWSRKSVCTRMNWFVTRIHQSETNWLNIPCWILLMFHQKDVNIFGVIFSVDAVPLHGGSHMSWWHHLSLLILTYTQHLEFW